MFSVAIVGAGNLGSRHLQALKLAQRNICIYVSEPGEEALRIAKERYDEYPDNDHVKYVRYMKDYKELPGTLDAVIIATDSSVRYKIAEWIVINIDAKYLILEKVVFQSIAEFESFDRIISSKPLKIWVNCPRRMNIFYKECREMVKDSNQIDIIMEGTDWGLTSSAIHMLDLFSFLTDDYDYSYDIAELVEDIYDSKRSGYIELYGKVTFASKRGLLILINNKNGTDKSKTVIKYKDGCIEVYERENRAFIRRNGQSSTEIPFETIYQSHLTNRLIEDLYDTGDCDLTTYEDSEKLHKTLIEAFLEHINKVKNEETAICPIT